MAKILIIEDQAVLLEELQDSLGFEGHDVIGASNGRDGVRLARTHLPDLIISDVMMPELDGYQVLEELRKTPGTETIPFLFLTAKAEIHDIRRGMKLGADDYLTKPFTRDDLLAAINVRLKRQAVLQKRAGKEMDFLRHSLIHTLPHELRTPLVGILGYGEILVENALTLNPEDLVTMGEDIIMAGQALQRLTENYLYYAQLEITVSDQQKTFALREARTEMAGTTTKLVAEELALKFGRAGDIAIFVEECNAHITDTDLQKLVYELVDNAFKFSPAGTRVTVSGKKVGNSFHICVDDHGRGFTRSDTSRVGAYMQFDRGIYEQQGSGLGLVIVKRLTEVYDGAMLIDSQTEQGTKIHIDIPAD